MAMKDYRKFMKTVVKNSNFYTKSESRKNTVKLVYTPTGECYSIHPSDKAIHDIKRWIKRLNK